MSSFAISHPVATVSRAIENIVIRGIESKNCLVKGGCALLSRVISLTVFPVFLALGLIFSRLPKVVFAIGDQARFNKKLDKAAKYFFAILASPLGLHSPEGVSGFFLKRAKAEGVRPFGVEEVYGKAADLVFPGSVEEVQAAILGAKAEGKQVSVVGAGMSQGTQTVPENGIVLNLRELKGIQLEGNCVKVGAGATWEEVQVALNRAGKSTIVKQASDIFSIGGSIGINCHGWAHEFGAIASTVEELEVIDAEGRLRVLTPRDEMFRCMFGTLGYFGVVVSAKLRVADNERLVQKCEEIDIDQFHEYYQNRVKGQGVPLFGGRLVLDSLKGAPLRRVCMVSYEKDRENPEVGPTKNFAMESKWGTRLERGALKMASHLSNFSIKRLISLFWSSERNAMLKGDRVTRNEAMHPPINAFKMLHHSNLHTQWLQEYFVKPENLPAFLRFLGRELKNNQVRLINATIRPTPQDRVSILPYAEQDRYGVVICFSQMKSEAEMEKTKGWIERVNRYLIDHGDVYYQAYMPFSSKEEFEACYGRNRVAEMRRLKGVYDPEGRFGNAHTAKYFDA